jgi:hypothetical protein
VDITEDSLPAAREMAAVEVEGELLLADSANVHRLNPTAGLVWRNLDGTYRLGELIDDLADVTGAPRETVAEDVLGTVRSFQAQNLLRPVDEETGERLDLFDVELPAEGFDSHHHDHDDDCGDPFATTEVTRGKVRYLEVTPNQ